MLQALSAELSANTKEKLSELDQSILQYVSAGTRRKLYKETQDAIIEASRLKRCMLKALPSTQKKSEIDSLVNLYYALEKAGIITNTDEEQKDGESK